MQGRDLGFDHHIGHAGHAACHQQPRTPGTSEALERYVIAAWLRATYWV
jgi:hypothetical protein